MCAGVALPAVVTSVTSPHALGRGEKPCVVVSARPRAHRARRCDRLPRRRRRGACIPTARRRSSRRRSGRSRGGGGRGRMLGDRTRGGACNESARPRFSGWLRATLGSAPTRAPYRGSPTRTVSTRPSASADFPIPRHITRWFSAATFITSSFARASGCLRAADLRPDVADDSPAPMTWSSAGGPTPGYGRALTLAALDCARAERCTSVTLNATCEGEPLIPAARFRALGFGRRGGSSPAPDERPTVTHAEADADSRRRLGRHA